MSETLPTTLPALYVDLDGTLHRGDLTDDGLAQLLKCRPWQLFSALWWWLAGSRAYCKRRMTEYVSVSAEEQVWIPEAIDFLKIEKAQGRKLVLISGSDERWVKPLGEHLAIFDDILGSDGKTNLIGKNKVAAIRALEGKKLYGYMGNSKTDFAVWKDSAEIVAVAAGDRFAESVQKRFPSAKIISIPTTSRPRLLLKILRVHQWLKNLLVFLPILLSHRLADGEAVGRGVLAFVSFSAAASAVYVLNDLLDLKHDRVHPAKRKRPFASGQLLPRYALILTPLLLIGAASAAAFLPPLFQSLLLTYLILTSLYSSVIKRIAILDVFLLAGLYVLRVLAGGAATDILVSGWLLIFSMFFFLNLAVLKRYCEVAHIEGIEMTPGSRRHINFGRAYAPGDAQFLQMFGFGAGLLSVLVLALYVSSPDVIQLYHMPEVLWLVAPIVLAWLARTWLSAIRGEVHHDPVVFAVRDRFSWVTAGVISILLALGQLL